MKLSMLSLSLALSLTSLPTIAAPMADLPLGGQSGLVHSVDYPCGRGWRLDYDGVCVRKRPRHHYYDRGWGPRDDRGWGPPRAYRRPPPPPGYGWGPPPPPPGWDRPRPRRGWGPPPGWD